MTLQNIRARADVFDMHTKMIKHAQQKHLKCSIRICYLYGFDSGIGFLWAM